MGTLSTKKLYSKTGYFDINKLIWLAFFLIIVIQIYILKTP